jgi:hypothetical protein
LADYVSKQKDYEGLESASQHCRNPAWAHARLLLGGSQDGTRGRQWTVLVSPSHWATIEVDHDKDVDQGTAENQVEAEDDGKDQDEDQGS